MQQIIVDVIVAAAFLFVAHWLFRNFVPKRAQQASASCGSCPQCAASEAVPVDGTPAPVTVRVKD